MKFLQRGTIGLAAPLGLALTLGNLIDARAQSGPFVYVPNALSSNVSAIDTTTNSVTGSTVPVGSRPVAVTVRGDGALVYVANAFSNLVSVIDTATNKVTATIPVGNTPDGIVVSADGSRVYVTNELSNSVSVINTATNMGAGTISVGNLPSGVAASADGSHVYVTNEGNNTISVISTATNAVTATIAVGNVPVGVAASADGSHVYVTNQNSNTISVINAATNTVTATIPVGNTPQGVTISPDGNHVYVANRGLGISTISVIDTATNTVTATITVGRTPAGVAVSPDGSHLYVTNDGDNTVSVIDTATNTVTATLAVGSHPASAGICGSGNALLAAGLTFKANTAGALGCTGANGPVFTGGTMQFAGANITSNLLITLMAAGGTFDTAGNRATLSGTISGPGGLTKIGAGTLVLSGANSYGGGTTISGGTLLLSGLGTLGAPTGTTIVNSGGTLDLGGTTQTQAALKLAGGTLQNGNLNAPITATGGIINGIGGGASLTTTAGFTMLFGINAYTGATSVNGGVLDVEGSITGTSSVSVNAGGTLTGTGTIDPLTVTLNSSSTFVPGNGTPGSSTTIMGNLAFQSGAMYVVTFDSSTASFANVTGTAALGGASVNALFAGGNVSKQYTILTASGGVSGTFASLVDTNLPANFRATLGYDANDAYLNLILNFGSGLNGNQHSVGNALVNYFNSNGSIPLVYSALSAAGLTQASGESATASQLTTFDAMSQFMGLLTDPFGRGNGMNGASSVTGYAEEDASASASAERKTTESFAVVTKAPPAPFVQRWSMWASGFGGSQSTDGNAALGSNSTTSRIAGTAVGAGYLFSPDTLAGFALAGGGTSFGVNNLGSGRSDLFQAGAYVRHTNGPAYITGALAYGWQDITTNRTVSIAGLDQLRAEFNANAFSGRIEGGYRFVAPWTGGVGITSYAAGQFTTFDLPAYAESVVSGAANFALNYAARSVTDSRSELGIRTDKSFAMEGGELMLRGRLAWAHDFDPDRSIGATFQALPGASFVVNGAALASDSALTTASVEMKWINNWSAAATFEGEFSNVTQSYAGKGVVRYAW